MPKEKEKFNTPKIAGLLEKVLIDTIQDPTLKLAEYNSGTGLYVIVSGKGFRQEFDIESSHNIGLLPFRIQNTYTYWISFSLDYNVLSKCVRHISISFFDESYGKLFRAEWANNTSGVLHAQPHWHFHNHKGVYGSDEWKAEELNEFVGGLQLVEGNKISSFHFAMSSTWQSNSNCAFPLNQDESKNLINWAKEVINYSINQFKYIHDKSSALTT